MNRMMWSTALQESAIVEQELAFVILLSVAALVAIASRRIRLPYTVSLVIVGLVLAFFPRPVQLEISSDLIVAILVPPLIFEGALAISWDNLRRNLLPILLLAVVGVLAGSAIVGGILIGTLRIPLFAALAFGALISATDPVAVIAFFRRLGVSRRLNVLVEGESLFNDGVAIVVFGLAVGAAGAAVAGTANSLTVGGAVAEFLIVSLGGLGVGFVLGYIVSEIVLKGIDDHLVETATTVAVAFGAYVVAERLGVSGILAVVAAGLIVGNIGLQNTSPTTKLTLSNFWEFLAFMANSLVFLIIGIQIRIPELVTDAWAIVIAVVAVLLARLLIVYSLTWLHGVIEPRRRIPMPYRHVMFWGGLRGAISLALALSLTAATFGEGNVLLLQHMTFGVVLFTLIVQGTTIEPLIRKLGIGDYPAQRTEQQARQARVYAVRAARRELDRLRSDGMLSQPVWKAMAQAYDDEIEGRRSSLREHLDAFPELELEMVLRARADLLRAERTAIADAMRRGLISEQVARDLVREVDHRVAALERIQLGGAEQSSVWGGDGPHRTEG